MVTRIYSCPRRDLTGYRPVKSEEDQSDRGIRNEYGRESSSGAVASVEVELDGERFVDGGLYWGCWWELAERSAAASLLLVRLELGCGGVGPGRVGGSVRGVWF